MTHRQLAVHEAAHAVIAAKHGMGIVRATLHAVDLVDDYQRNDVAFRVTLLAGQIAEERFAGGSTTETQQSGSEDLARVWLSLSGDPDTAEEKLGVLRTLAKAHVDLHWPAIVRVAEALERHGELTGEQLQPIIAGRRQAVASRAS